MTATQRFPRPFSHAYANQPNLTLVLTSMYGHMTVGPICDLSIRAKVRHSPVAETGTAALATPQPTLMQAAEGGDFETPSMLPAASRDAGCLWRCDFCGVECSGSGVEAGFDAVVRLSADGAALGEAAQDACCNVPPSNLPLHSGSVKCCAVPAKAVPSAESAFESRIRVIAAPSRHILCDPEHVRT